MGDLVFCLALVAIGLVVLLTWASRDRHHVGRDRDGDADDDKATARKVAGAKPTPS